MLESLSSYDFHYSLTDFDLTRLQRDLVDPSTTATFARLHGSGTPLQCSKASNTYIYIPGGNIPSDCHTLAAVVLPLPLPQVCEHAFRVSLLLLLIMRRLPLVHPHRSRQQMQPRYPLVSSHSLAKPAGAVLFRKDAQPTHSMPLCSRYLSRSSIKTAKTRAHKARCLNQNGQN